MVKILKNYHLTCFYHVFFSINSIFKEHFLTILVSFFIIFDFNQVLLSFP